MTEAVFRMVFRMDYQEPGCTEELAKALFEAVSAECNPGTHVPRLIMVGDPETVGDAVGPLVGRILAKSSARALCVGGGCRWFNAKTLNKAAEAARRSAAQSHRQPFIIAIDAAVGKPGVITLNSGPLRPGGGLGKELPPIGHLHIMAGTVQSTVEPGTPFGDWYYSFRLRTVPRKLADSLAQVIAQAFISFAERWDSHALEEYSHDAAAARTD